MRAHFSGILYTLGGAIVLLAAAWYNGFPLIYSDTSTYLASGFDWVTPPDRPITYGLFLWVTSGFGFSLWLSCLVQNLILSYLIFVTVRSFGTFRSHYLPTLLGIIVAAAFSTLSWSMATMIPDIFTPITLLLLANLLLAKARTRRESALWYFLFFLAVAMHISHLLLAVGSLILLAILEKWWWKSGLLSFRKMGVLGILAFSTMLIMGSAVAKSRHIFLMGRMVESGILKIYLDENCVDKDYALCAYRDSLPETVTDFMWNQAESPLYKIGGWKSTKAEFNDIIVQTLVRPRYLIRHLFESVKITVVQTFTFTIDSWLGPHPRGSKLEERIRRYLPADAFQYNSSRQQTGRLRPLPFMNASNTIFITLSVLGLLWLLLRPSNFTALPRSVQLLLYLFILGILANNAIAATFADVADRFNCRVIWLLSLGVLVASSHWQKKQ